MVNIGFFYVKNFNISQERVNRQFTLGKAFYDLPQEEKDKYHVQEIEQGKYNGYVPAGRSMCAELLQNSRDLLFRICSIDEKTGLRSRVEIYNIPSKCNS